MTARLQRAIKLATAIRDRQYSQHIHLSKEETEDLAYGIFALIPPDKQPSEVVGNDDPIDGAESQVSKANRRQVAGEHYGLSAFQHWDIVAMFKLDYFQGQITKYVMRWRKKNGIPDLEKAAHFLEKYIELAREGKISDDNA